jgi:hypothetical chaperone protein
MQAGFDYGTSNCSIGTARDGVVELMPLEDGSPYIPSTLYAPRPQVVLDRVEVAAEGGQSLLLDLTARSFAELSFGRAALAEYLRAPSEGYFVKSPKSFLGARGLSEEVKERFIGIVAAMMANVKRRAEEASKETIEDVVIGRPINFQGDGGEEENQQALMMLVAAAREAGFANIAFLYEPMAAAMEYELKLDRERRVLVIDIGGGTTDCSFVRVGPKRVRHKERGEDILGHAGERVGGNDYDQLLALHAITPALGFGDSLKSGLPIPNKYYVDAVSTNDVNAQQRFYTRRTRERLLEMTRDAVAPERLKRFVQVQTGRLTYRVLRASEDAKIALSDADVTCIDLSFLEEGLATSADRELLKRGCERLLLHLEGLVSEAMKQAGTKPDVAYLTGGMAGSTVVRDYLGRVLPDVACVDSDHFGSVTQGLAIWAERLFRA